MVIHLQESDGAAKCGANVYYDCTWQDNKIISKEKRISRNKSMFMIFGNESNPPTCKRCLNKVVRPISTKIGTDMTGQYFHRSFGYDMTINVFAVVIRQDDKSLVCQECNSCITGSPWDPGGTGKAAAGSLNKEKKPFRMFKKITKDNYEYWTGAGEHWYIIDPLQDFYENRCD